MMIVEPDIDRVEFTVLTEYLYVGRAKSDGNN